MGMQKNWGSSLWGANNGTKHVYGKNEMSSLLGGCNVIYREIDAAGMEMPSASVWYSTL